MKKLQDFSEEEREYLLTVARQVIENKIMHIEFEMPKDVPQKFLENGACFVTLEQKGQLRGCIGSLEAHESLIKNIIRNAYNSAFKDPRFINALENNVIWMIAFLIIPVLLGFILALVLNTGIKGETFFKSVFYFPGIISFIVIGIIFLLIF